MQPSLFDGATFDAEQDAERLTGQLLRVFAFMRDGQWHTLTEIATQVGGSEAAVSARLRDLRKTRFGGYVVNRRRYSFGSGLFEYQLIVS